MDPHIILELKKSTILLLAQLLYIHEEVEGETEIGQEGLIALIQQTDFVELEPIKHGVYPAPLRAPKKSYQYHTKASFYYTPFNGA